MGGKKRELFSVTYYRQETHPSANGWPKRKKNLDRMREKRRPTEWQMQKGEKLKQLNNAEGP